MSPEQRDFLNLVRRPARLSVEQAAWQLNCKVHDMARLIHAGLIRPLGRPAPNAPKFFATVDLDACGQDRKWLARATDVIQSYWRSQNSRKPSRARPPFHRQAKPMQMA